MILYRMESMRPDRIPSDHAQGAWANSSHPTPRVDGIEGFSWADYCACESISQLAHWWKHLINQYDQTQELMVVAIEIDERYVKRGRQQVMCELSKATRMTVLDMGWEYIRAFAPKQITLGKKPEYQVRKVQPPAPPKFFWNDKDWEWSEDSLQDALIYTAPAPLFTGRAFYLPSLSVT